MYHFWWLIHVCGIALWFGGIATGVLMWPSKKSFVPQERDTVDVRTMVRVITRTSHLGAGLTAVGGLLLSLLVQPKSVLGSLWLTTMQGLGVVAFIVSVFVLTRMGKRLLQHADHAEMNAAVTHQFRIYYAWLVIVFILLLVSLIMGAFKPRL
ncbi:hypothetical protein [Alicyclobacillus mengziensis]|uniref:Uncharacterized protein n=1 Tax=Alicyclobacillus mengziensis TaxID=2931921 RepID=A0A9X7VXF1_9BACL|nr:hypothetical protein [Alicyclobacillus mengziensis]QSO46836.1 hypothetical protein JZ786_20765 [Alicyclobacillus mengziensis]